MAELADATVLGAVGSPVQVQVLLSACWMKAGNMGILLMNRYVSGFFKSFLSDEMIDREKET